MRISRQHVIINKSDIGSWLTETIQYVVTCDVLMREIVHNKAIEVSEDLKECPKRYKSG